MTAPPVSAPGGMHDPTPAPSHHLEVPPTGEIDALALPARPGVAVFRDLAGRAAIIATTADLRALARRRLGLDTPVAETAETAAPRPPRTDHRAVIRRVEAHVTGSALESDVLYLALARELMPEVYQTVRQRFEAWVVHVDPDERFPEWTRHGLSAAAALPSRGVLLGPFPDRDAAGRFIAGAIDAFDLCREQSLLVQAPSARACPYKEMGRCPAPCDGSEPLVSYQARVRRAAGVLRGGLAQVRERLEADMKAAAVAMEFEHAAELKAQVDRLKALAAPAVAHAVDLRNWRAAIVLPATPSRRPPWVRILRLDAGRLTPLGECSLADDAAAERLTLASRALAADEAPPALTPAAADTLGVVTRWLYTPATRRRGELLTLAPDATPVALAAELQRVGRAMARRRSGDAADEHVEREAAPPPA
jgi:DNA polymerase-3 subunit epsilon